MMRIAWILGAATAAFLVASPALAGMTTCRMNYNLKGWSLFYKQYDGTGTVTCENGQSATVQIKVRGGGLTIGKSEISGGVGRFTGVTGIDEIYGTYAAVDGHAGATKSAEAWAMTKGEISLALSGTGRGFDLGIALTGFTIKR